MEPFVCHPLTINVIGESVVLTEDDEDISPSCKHQMIKQKRKASTISLKDNGKTKSRIIKGRRSLAQNTHNMTEVLRFVETCNVKTDDGDHLSTLNELQTEHDEDDHTTARLLKQLTLDETDMTQCRQRNGVTNSQKNEYTEDGIDLTVREKPNWSKEVEQTNMNLEKKLADDHEFNIIGIMNVSSMNLIDSDVPLIIYRAFQERPKKCIGLILRDNAFTSDGVKTLVDQLLMLRTNLKYLSLSNNPNVGDVGIEHLTRLLQKNRSITFLALPNTGITDHGVRLLADTLCAVNEDTSCSPLEKLYISYNKLITDESLEPILQILEQNQTLKLLSLQYCGLSDSARRRLRQVGAKKKKKKFSLSE